MIFRSNGKLLLSGEYFILNGSKAIGLPCKKGQILKIEPNIKTSNIIWETWDENENLIMHANFDKDNLKFINGKINKLHLNHLIKILNYLKKISPICFKFPIKIYTKIEFNINWGLGSSSTLINNLSKWAKINPYKFLQNSFGGSGYDIACANSEKPILYQIKKNSRSIKKKKFKPEFLDNLYFIYLNKKQNSRDEIKKFLKIQKPSSLLIDSISEISEKMIESKNQKEFNFLINQHEQIISKHLNKIPIKKKMFNDFDGEIKSLGAWGGDFILASSLNKDFNKYFKKLGYYIIFKYSDLIK